MSRGALDCTRGIILTKGAQARSLDKRMTYKQMEANDHSFSDTARNWGGSRPLLDD